MWDEKYLSVGTPEDEDIEHSRLAKTSKHGIVEIGVLKGHTSKIFLTSSPKVKVYGIDPIIPDSMNPALIGNEALIRVLEKEHDNYKFFKDYSYNVVKTFKEPFDFIFIDGDHEYSAVRNDFEDWFSLLFNGGYLSIHDSAKNRGGPIHWDGPSLLADELLSDGRVEYIKTIYCTTIFRKK